MENSLFKNELDLTDSEKYTCRKLLNLNDSLETELEKADEFFTYSKNILSGLAKICPEENYANELNQIDECKKQWIDVITYLYSEELN